MYENETSSSLSETSYWISEDTYVKDESREVREVYLFIHIKQSARHVHQQHEDIGYKRIARYELRHSAVRFLPGANEVAVSLFEHAHLVIFIRICLRDSYTGYTVLEICVDLSYALPRFGKRTVHLEPLF